MTLNQILLTFYQMKKTKAKFREPLFEFVNPKVEYRIENRDALETLRGMEGGKFDLMSCPEIG